MGVLDIFLSKEKRSQKALETNIHRATDKFRQSPDRIRALEILLAIGSDEALVGLMRRFDMTYDKSIEDEQEKEWVCETLIARGEAILPALRRYLKITGSVSWPLRVLSEVVSGKEQELEVIGEILQRHEPGYERDPTKKIQLITHLGTLKQTGSAELVAPYLADMDEGVRFACVEALLRHKNEAVAREKLLELFVSDAEESLRLRIRICDGFADLQWLVVGFRGEVEKRLPDGFTLDREGHIKNKASAKQG